MKNVYDVILPISRVMEKGDLLIEVQTENNIERLSVGLSLLARDLIETLRIVDRADRYRLSVAKNSRTDIPRCMVEKVNADGMSILASPVELEFWLEFFLTYLRDGGSSVDHIDVDIPLSGDDLVGVYITFVVPYPGFQDL